MSSHSETVSDGFDVLESDAIAQGRRSTAAFQSRLSSVILRASDRESAIVECLRDLLGQFDAKTVLFLEGASARAKVCAGGRDDCDCAQEQLMELALDAQFIRAAKQSGDLAAQTWVDEARFGGSVWLQPVDADARSAIVISVAGAREPTDDEQTALTSAAMAFRFAVEIFDNQDQLAAEAERFASLTRSIPGVVYQRVVEPDDSIYYTYISESAEDLFGVSAQEILSNPKALFNSYARDYAKDFRSRLIEASKTLSTWDVEASIIMPDGSTKYTHAIAKPHRREDGAVVWTGVILDATRIKEAERMAAETEARTRTAIIENLSHGFLMFDAEDRLILSNSRYFELYGDLIPVVGAGVKYRDVITAELQLEIHEARSDRALAARRDERLENHRGSRDFVIERRIGSDVWVQINEHKVEDGSTVVLYTDVSEMRLREERIHHMALHDALTGLPNRILFRQRIDQALKNASKYGGQVAVLCLDLDNFKNINDTLGHPLGDLLLVEVVNRIRECIRDSDTLARLGGDEFALIIPELGAEITLDAVASRIIEAVSAPFCLRGQRAVVGASIGVALNSDEAYDADTIIKNADLALYRAKSDGKNCFRYFEPEMDVKAQERRVLELDLRTGIDCGQLQLYYQPQIDANDGTLRSFEALIRWNHPQRGLIAPAEFIGIAEETGLIIPLGDWVLRNACAAAVEWPERVCVAINVSPAQLRRRDFVKIVADTLEETQLTPSRLELEITETVLLRDAKGALEVLHMLKGMGVRIAMDDFGTGYSSLGNLRRFPFDKIKIDRSFVSELINSSEAAAIVKAVVSMGNTLAIETTAEGVETIDQVRHLEAEGCSQFQGFYYSRPIPGEQVRDLISKSTLSKRSSD